MRQWDQYCDALGLDKKDKTLLSNQYYLNGFESWKAKQKEYCYYKQQQIAIRGRIDYKPYYQNSSEVDWIEFYSNSDNFEVLKSGFSWETDK